MRECGGCTLCCRVLGVHELKKPPLAECSHCHVMGCSIYKDRPKECREFNCIWLMDNSLPEELKPSKSHVVLSNIEHDVSIQGIEVPSKTIIVHIDPYFPTAYKEGAMKVFLNKELKAGTALIVVRPDQQKEFMRWGKVEDGL